MFEHLFGQIHLKIPPCTYSKSTKSHCNLSVPPWIFFPCTFPIVHFPLTSTLSGTITTHLGPLALCLTGQSHYVPKQRAEQ